MLQFLWSNIKHTFKNQKMLSVIMFCVQLFSVVIVVFSYGVINHFNFKVSEKESTTLIYNFLTVATGETEFATVDMNDVDKFLKEALPEIEKKLDYFFVMGSAEGAGIQCSSGYKSGKFTVSTQIKRRVGIKSGEKFTDQQMNSSEKLVIASEELVDSDGNVTIEGEKYKAIGVTPGNVITGWVFIPYKAIPEETEVYYISFIFKQPLWEGEYNSIVKLMTDIFGANFIIPEFEGIINESSNRVYRDIMFVTGFLIVVCAVNYCIMYRYMLEKRRREFAITRICGCSKYKAGIVYMVELLGTSILTLLIGIFMYHNWILPEAKEYFTYIGLFYSEKVYRTIASIYTGALGFSYLVLVSRFVRKTPVALVKEV